MSLWEVAASWFPLLTVAMNKKRNRIGSKVEGSVSAQTILSCKQNSSSQLLINGVLNDRLGDFEDIAQYDSSGVPFLLVDGIYVRTRQQLHTTLSKREKKCMRRTQRQCCVLPWLEYTRPAPETEPLTIEEKEAKEELDFQTDLQLLQLRIEDKSLAYEVTDSDSRIEHVASPVDVAPNLSRMKEIRMQLEKLREQQQDDPVEPLPVLSDELRIRRQATFDIECDAKEDSLPPSFSSNFPIESQQRLIRAPTISQLPRIECRPSFKKMHTSTHLSKKTPSNVTLGSKDCRSEPFKAPGTTLVNKIGDLLMQIPEKRAKSDMSDGSYSYVVAVAPNLESKRCNVEPLTLPKARALTFPIASSYVAEKYKRDTTFAIIAAPLQTKSRTFLKVPTLFKKIKK